MIPILLISHGSFAASMIESAEMILGKKSDLYLCSISKDESPSEFAKKIIPLIERLSDKNDLIVLSDFPLSTPFNQLVSLSRKHRFFHLTGINMPLLLYLLNNREEYVDCELLCQKALAAGSEQMFDVCEFIKEFVQD